MTIPSTLKQIREAIKNGEVSLSDAVKYYLSNIEKTKHLNTYISVFGDEALARAEEVQEKIISGNAGKLAGLVVSVKDVISVKDKPLTCGSKILTGFTAQYNATAVQRMLDEDAIIIGKTNCDEFAMGSSNENSYYGVCRNPIDDTRVPGGSSGGSAVAVASDTCLLSLGSETGGSIRQPAAFCGITGLKMTYGRISRFGLTAFASSLDSIGIFGKNAEDIGALLGVIGGKDERDSTSSDVPVFDYANELTKEIKPGSVKIGYVKEYFGEGLAPEIKDGVLKKIENLKNEGFEVKEISLPNFEYGIPVYYILACAEASSNLARYDGVRYGQRSENSGTVEDMFVNTRTEGFGTEVKRRIMLGTYVLSSGYYDAYYKKAQKVRRLIREDLERAFEDVDYIISPTTPTTAFKIGAKTDDPLAMYLNDIYTVCVNIAGIPAISVPAGNDSEGLPYGVQVMGRKFDEAGLLKMASLVNKY